MDSRSNTSIKLDAIQRLVMVNTLSKILPLYIVTEYPKSGGSWLAQIISTYLDIPFPRNERPKISSCIMHGHMMHSPMMSNVFCLHRDGRDIIVSLYFHSLFQNDKNSPLLVDRCRNDLNFQDYDDVKNNLPKFIEYIYTRDLKSKSPFRFTWLEFVNSWKDVDCAHIKYEDMIADTVGVVSKAIEKITNQSIDSVRLSKIVDHYSFANQTKRKQGIENKKSFLRKGQPGDWREKFSPEAAKIFHKYYGDALIQLGYVDGDDWITDLS